MEKIEIKENNKKNKSFETSIDLNSTNPFAPQVGGIALHFEKFCVFCPPPKKGSGAFAPEKILQKVEVRGKMFDHFTRFLSFF